MAAGAFSSTCILKLIFLLQLSLNYNLSPKQHYELAKDLSPLRDKGVLILGSGNMVHNLGIINWENIDKGADWAEQANSRFKKLIMDNEHEKLINYESLGKDIELSVPSAEHYLPLLYVLALKDTDVKIIFFNDKCVYGSLSMTSLLIR
jgi:4,5-DOPA dioxygenase extradiol